MPHIPDDSEIADYVAKGSIFVIVCFFAFCIIVLPVAFLIR